MKETARQSSVIKEKLSQVFVNGKNTMAVMGIYQLKGHRGSAFHGIFIAAGRAETAMASERDKFKFSATGASIHCPAERGGATANHFIHVFYDRLTWM